MDDLELAAETVLERRTTGANEVFPYLLAYADYFEGISKVLTAFGSMLIGFADWWIKISPEICDWISNLHLSGYSDEEIKALIESYKCWGRYAWAASPEQSWDAFKCPPLSQEDADNKMKAYCNMSNITHMKDSLVNKGIRESDLEEAYFCWQNKKYQACCLVLFGLIDRELINYGYLTKKNFRKSGEGAIEKLREEKGQESYNKILFANLCFLNIMEALAALFRGRDNFQNEPDYVNRNYIAHGMSNRAVTELDCFRVWSALYGLVVLLPKLEEITV